MANAKSIKVTPEELRTISNNIAGKAEEYKGTVSTLYSKVDAMAAAWEGKDNLEYAAQIRAFKPQLEKMEQLMREYSQFLQTASKAYDDVQGQIYNKAQTLVN